MACELAGSIKDADRATRGGKDQPCPGEVGRDAVVVSLEARVTGLVDAHPEHLVVPEGIARQADELLPFVCKSVPDQQAAVVEPGALNGIRFDSFLCPGFKTCADAGMQVGT